MMSPKARPCLMCQGRGYIANDTLGTSSYHKCPFCGGRGETAGKTATKTAGKTSGYVQ